MEESNESIIANLKAIQCNSVFMSIKVSQTPASIMNLGLYTYASDYIPIPPMPPYTQSYQEKLTDFINLATNQNPPIKVLALQVDNMDFRAWDFNAIDKIAYYQRNVRNINPFINKKCLFDGVVTNVEPWDLTTGITINGSYKEWHTSFCSGNNRQINEEIMAHYLNFISEMKTHLQNGNYFNPTQPINNQQIVANTFSGSTHWYFHYYSKRYPTDFPSGSFNQMIGSTKFNFIIPQTYCGQNSESCIDNPCLDPNLLSFCTAYTGTDDDEGLYDLFTESYGKCCCWFAKHFTTNQMYTGFQNYTIPINAAPMLYGHSAFMFDSKQEVADIRSTAASISATNPNYRGSVIFDYEVLFQLPNGSGILNPACSPCSSLPDSPIGLENFNFYPNPIIDELFIEGLSGTQKAVILDFFNEKRLESHVSPMNVTSLPEGFYVLIIVDGSNNVLYRKTISINR